MNIRLNRIVLTCATALLGGSVWAFSPGIVYDQAGKFDKSFSEAAYQGVERFKKEFQIDYFEGQVTSEAQKEQMLRKMARKRLDLIIAVGFTFTEAVEKVSRAFPDVKFTLIDAVAKGEKIRSVVFKEQEGAFLVGMAAALKSKTATIGFIGAMNVPIIQTFSCGFSQGAHYVNNKIQLIQNFVGVTPAAFNDPARGAELSRSQFDRGVDVVFAAAGATGLAVLAAAHKAQRYAIGVDSNQDGLFPGSVLTSMVKRVDVAVYETLKAAKEGRWQPGVAVFGLKEKGVDWTLDAYNRSLITAQMEQRIEQARQDIIAGKITIQCAK